MLPMVPVFIGISIVEVEEMPVVVTWRVEEVCRQAPLLTEKLKYFARKLPGFSRAKRADSIFGNGIAFGLGWIEVIREISREVVSVPVWRQCSMLRRQDQGNEVLLIHSECSAVPDEVAF